MSADLHQGIAHHILHLGCLDVGDLEYIEKDLCYYELVSLGFLLYGDDPVKRQYILQKLLVLFNALPHGKANILRPYAKMNPKWKPFLIEALAIIKAKQVLRKLGFRWEELRQYYLPHIPELAVHINPLIKALYVLCEQMSPVQTASMINDINKEYKKANDLRFYDTNYLEIFLLDWLSHKIIQVQVHHGKVMANLQVLIHHLKINDLDKLKDLLLQAIQSNCKEDELSLARDENTENYSSIVKFYEKLKFPKDELPEEENVQNISPLSNECYLVRRETAGVVLIINQKSFYEDSDPELRHLLPPTKLRDRQGTDVDKIRLKKVFSSFGYNVLELDNLTHIEILSEIRETVIRSFQYDSLIVCILSHGIDGCVFGCNSIPVKISDVEDIITLDTLQGKPKMLIVQACQKKESGMENNKKAYNAKSKPAYVDVIKAMSTVPGHTSIRHTGTGSWFIQSLCDKIDELADRTQISDILIAVTRDVTDKRGTNDEVMVPITNFTLRKHFFLPSRR